jgi:hypothetical protein
MAVILNGDAGVTTTSGAEYNGLQQYASQSAIGTTSVIFTNIPSFVKRITLQIYNVSLLSSFGGTDQRVRVGTAIAGGLLSSGYTAGITTTTASSTITAITNGISGFPISAAATAVSGQFVLTNVSGNVWVSTGMVYRFGDTALTYSAGSIDLGGDPLDRVGLVNMGIGFDAGTVNVIYE